MSALNELRGPDTTRWPNITAAEDLSRRKLALLTDAVRGLLPTDEGGLIVFGSLARREFTLGSDLDWAVLIDGQANSQHLQIAREIKIEVEKAGFGRPGPTGVFGGLVFSHELIHAIGDDEDTNRNMTRRLLLLLESAPITESASQIVHSRIIRGIITRYVEEDASFIRPDEQKGRIPRFLLNDVVRFWRTMAVDYANKHRERGGEKWALRNIKLRMSRKLLFVSGLFMCATWALNDEGSDTDAFRSLKLKEHLLLWTQRPPLESLALLVKEHAPNLADDILGNYDRFLSLLTENEARETLESLSPEEAYENPVFLNAREIAIDFDSALLKLMFESDKRVADLIKKYGVF
ncbi:Putative nucleotidyltransferase DUF294 [Palleronia marisminoris]|uniref:Protein-PII uridylyltransferase N-terminal domain-containing protein n=1 Tax=Palleronia marisminoris TaxID=315423 RepID=A0A1Y5S0B2_9RHOB|nr:DUF294 nucleotidyltransferase-like domain-containing protein [Palleronia marisminoris]SFG40853.1 Putative nucleotidyltransferase DUF294 [Palleronia marisminoris]SLN28649.1 hypothetical protein PAM7066_01142 [Palleronia marisminoris]